MDLYHTLEFSVLILDLLDIRSIWITMKKGISYLLEKERHLSINDNFIFINKIVAYLLTF